MSTIINLDKNLQFSILGTRIPDNDPINITAEAGVPVTLQLQCPISFTATHDEKGTTYRWAPVTTTASPFAAEYTFPCPRSPFTLTVSSGDATTATSKPVTKKVRIEAGAAGALKHERGLQGQNPNHGHDHSE